MVFRSARVCETWWNGGMAYLELWWLLDGWGKLVEGRREVASGKVGMVGCRLEDDPQGSGARFIV